MDLNSQQILHDFHVLKNRLGLSEMIIDKAKYVIREANEKGLVRGRTHTTIVAAAVYIACRETENPRPLHDIATIANVKRKILAKYCRMLINKLYPKLPAIDLSKCMIRLADMINVNERAKRLAAIMINEIRRYRQERVLWPLLHRYFTFAIKKLVIIQVNTISLKQQE